MDAALPTVIPRALRFAPGALAMALLTALFAFHASACAVCSAPSDDVSRLARAATPDVVAVRTLGTPRSRTPGGASVRPTHAPSEIPVVPLQALSASALNGLADVDSRNTALAHRAVTVLQI
jgi:hypothetical protein